MNSQSSKNPQREPAGGPPPATSAGSAADRPDWANGLRQLYDAVVDEPLPDSFRDLLDQLDSKD